MLYFDGIVSTLNERMPPHQTWIEAPTSHDVKGWSTS